MAHSVGEGLSVLVVEGVVVVPDPLQTVALVLVGVKKLDIVEDGLVAVFQENL